MSSAYGHWIEWLNEARTDIGHLIECLEYWLPDETMVSGEHEEQYQAAIKTIQDAKENMS